MNIYDSTPDISQHLSSLNKKVGCSNGKDNKFFSKNCKNPFSNKAVKRKINRIRKFLCVKKEEPPGGSEDSSLSVAP